eukprot:3389750-Rhodomonas_salina.1
MLKGCWIPSRQGRTQRGRAWLGVRLDRSTPHAPKQPDTSTRMLTRARACVPLSAIEHVTLGFPPPCRPLLALKSALLSPTLSARTPYASSLLAHSAARPWLPLEQCSAPIRKDLQRTA